MPGIHLPETDLILSRPAAGERWDPHTIHTHYFGFCVPEAAIGAFVYVRYMPAFSLCGAGVILYQGPENRVLADSLFHDYQLTLPWPEVDGNTIRTANGLTIAFPEPGRHARIAFDSADCAFEVDAVAVTPLAARGHVLPGEDLGGSDASGGSEQFMHYTGQVRVGDGTYAVDCHYARDRSWRQVRTEARDSPPGPPMSWTPVYFDDDLAFNQAGIEHGGDGPSFHFAWVYRNGEIRDIVDVRRTVTRAHPQLHAPLAMEIEATDDAGETYQLSGEAIGFSPLPGWHNLTSFESLMRWSTADGRIAHGPAQSVWSQPAHHALKRAAEAAIGA